MARLDDLNDLDDNINSDLVARATEGGVSGLREFIAEIRQQCTTREEFETVLNRRVGDERLSALHAACLCNQTDVIEILLDEGAEVDTVDLHGDTPLHAVSGLGNVEIVKLLCARGADVSVYDDEKMTPFHAAAVESRSDVIDHLAKYGNPLQIKAGINSISDSGLAPAHFAAISGCVECLAALMDAGADVNVHNERTGGRPLHLLVGHADAPTIRKFIKIAREKGVKLDVDAIDEHGRTPLLIACLQKRRKAAAALIDAGANTNASDDEGRTPENDFASVVKDARQLSSIHRHRTPLILGNTTLVILFMLFLIYSRPFKWISAVFE